MKKKKLIKNKCEIEGCEEVDNLHLHHIIFRTHPDTSDHNLNLAILCPNHHNYVHSNPPRLKIIGVYPATKPPNGRILVYVLDGVKNIDIDEAYFAFKKKEE